MTAEPRCWGGGVSHPSQLTTGLVIKSVTTSPTLAGERMLFILQVSILSEQAGNFKALRAKQTQQVRATRSTTGFEGAETKNNGQVWVWPGLPVKGGVWGSGGPADR